jgi:hypothetical protein
VKVLVGLILGSGGALVCGVMLVTGYMPWMGFGHDAAHAARFGLAFGVAAGALFVVAVGGLLGDRR